MSLRFALRCRAGTCSGAAAVLVALTAVPLTATAAPYPPSNPCALSATAYSADDSVGFTLAASGFVPREPVELTLGPTAIHAATASADDDGNVHAVFAVPREVARTADALTANAASASCTVTSPPIPPPVEDIPPGTATAPSTTSRIAPGGTTGAPRAAPRSSATPAPSSASREPTISIVGPSDQAEEPRMHDAGVSPWLIVGISAGLLIFGLLGTRLLTRRSG